MHPNLKSLRQNEKYLQGLEVMGARRRRVNKAFVAGSLNSDAGDNFVDPECGFGSGRVRMNHQPKKEISTMTLVCISAVLLAGFFILVGIEYRAA